MKKHFIFGAGIALIALAAYAQTGHLRQTVETSPLARQLLTNDTAAEWNAILGSGTNGGNLPTLGPGQILIGNNSSIVTANGITGDATLGVSGILSLSANIPRLNQPNNFSSTVTFSGGLIGSGANITGIPAANITGIFPAVSLGSGSPNANTVLLGSSVWSGSPAISAANMTAIPAVQLAGTVPTSNLGSGTANNTSYLRGDQTWATSPNGISQSGGFGTNTTVSNLTTTGNSTLGGTVSIANATGNIGGTTNYQSTNLIGANGYAFFGVGMIPRRYEPTGSHVPSWGGAQVFSADGISWSGASGFPSVVNTNNCVRDISVYKSGSVLCAATTAGTGGDPAIPYVNIFTSTNGGAAWNFITNAYFTNAALSLENPSNTWGPTWFNWNSKTYLITGCFFGSGATRNFRIIQCLDTNGFTSWSTATNVSMTGITSTTANGPFLYDDTLNSGNWYLWHEESSATLYLYKSSTPLGPWTNVMNLNVNGQISEGACMFHLPNGKYRLYIDNYFAGTEGFVESATIESGWSSFTNLNTKAYFGNFKPIIITNLNDIAAASAATASASTQNWEPFIPSVNWATSADFAAFDFGVKTNVNNISNGTHPMSLGYRYSEGIELNVNGYPKILVAGESGYVGVGGLGIIATNGVSSFANTNGNSAVGSIVITSTGFTNTLGIMIQGYLAVTNTSVWTNYNGLGVVWSTNTGPSTNVHFTIQAGGKIMAPANAIDISPGRTTWTAW